MWHMTENEAKLREWLANNGGEALAWLPGAFDAVLAAHRSGARAEALEEARETFPTSGVFSGETVRGILRKLGATPAPASIPAERVRDVITDLGHGTGNDGAEEYDKACRDFARETLHRLGMPLDGGQGAEGHAGREFIRSMGVNPDAVDPLCECGEVLSVHRRGGRRGIDETDPPYRTLCVGFRAKVAS